MIRTSFVLTWPTPGIPVSDLPRYWGLVAEIALRVKDDELARGLNRFGKPLPGVRSKTRRYRKSAMTPDGRGDPNAPYLTPGHGLSRTRSLLAAKARKDGVVIWWRFDAFTGGEWGRILRYHALRGRAYDVIGLSPAGIEKVKTEANAKFKMTPDLPAPRRSRPFSPPQGIGRMSLDHVDPERADEIAKAFKAGKASGFLSKEEWAKYWRSGRTTGTLSQPARTSASVRAGHSNQILKHVFEVRPPSSPTFLARVKNLFARAINKAFGLEQGI